MILGELKHVPKNKRMLTWFAVVVCVCGMVLGFFQFYFLSSLEVAEGFLFLLLTPAEWTRNCEPQRKYFLHNVVHIVLKMCLLILAAPCVPCLLRVFLVCVTKAR